MHFQWIPANTITGKSGIPKTTDKISQRSTQKYVSERNWLTYKHKIVSSPVWNSNDERKTTNIPPLNWTTSITVESAQFLSLGTEQNCTNDEKYELGGWYYFGRGEMGSLRYI